MPTLQETVEAETVEDDDTRWVIDLFEVRRANEDDATDEHVVGTGTCGSTRVERSGVMEVSCAHHCGYITKKITLKCKLTLELVVDTHVYVLTQTTALSPDPQPAATSIDVRLPRRRCRRGPAVC